MKKKNLKAGNVKQVVGPCALLGLCVHVIIWCAQQVVGP